MYIYNEQNIYILFELAYSCMSCIGKNRPKLTKILVNCKYIELKTKQSNLRILSHKLL